MLCNFVNKFADKITDSPATWRIAWLNCSVLWNVAIWLRENCTLNLLYFYILISFFFCGIPWNNFITVRVYFRNNVNVYGTENVEPRICETSKREITKQWNYFRRSIITKYRLTYFILTFRSINILFDILHLKTSLCCNSTEKVEAKHRRSTHSFKHRFQLHESNPT